MNDRTKAALIGGVVAGVLSGLPVVGGCCFLWAIGGGILAIYLYMKNTPAPMEMADAAKLGAIAGAIGAAISLALGLPFMMLGIGTAAVQNNADLERAGIGAGMMAGLGFGALVIRAVIVLGCGALGGIIGAAIFGKNRPGAGAPPPPPPPDFGGQQGGGYGGGGTGGTTGGSFGAGS